MYRLTALACLSLGLGPALVAQKPLPTDRQAGAAAVTVNATNAVAAANFGRPSAAERGRDELRCLEHRRQVLFDLVRPTAREQAERAARSAMIWQTVIDMSALSE